MYFSSSRRRFPSRLFRNFDNFFFFFFSFFRRNIKKRLWIKSSFVYPIFLCSFYMYVYFFQISYQTWTIYSRERYKFLSTHTFETSYLTNFEKYEIVCYLAIKTFIKILCLNFFIKFIFLNIKTRIILL